jgi:MscS family membrane protein
MEWLNSVLWNNTVLDYLYAAGLVVLSWIVAIVVKSLIQRAIARAGETRSRIDDVLAGVGTWPMTLIILLAGLHGAIRLLTIPPSVERVAWTFLVVIWTLVGAFFLSRLLNGLFYHYLGRYARQSEEALYRQLARMIRSLTSIVIWVVAAVFVISNLGFDVSSLLAGLGLGGFALAMASKDTLSNLFGSFTILVNGPYKVGDVVKYQGHEGTVEEIGLRDSRIRTYNGNLVIVPNAHAPTSAVENISRRPTFRVLFKLGLTYQTSAAQIDRAIELAREAILAEEGVGEKALVHFVGFADSAIELQVIYYIEDSSRILDAQHSINRKIKVTFEEAEIQFAYPTMTIQQA